MPFYPDLRPGRCPEWGNFGTFRPPTRTGDGIVRLWRRGGADPAARRAAERRGRGAEAAAILWLRLKGYRILDRRVRTPVGEIDLIARRGGILCFVEVKARATRDAALAALTPHQADRIARAALYWSRHRPEAATCGWRFDIVAIAPGRRPRHLPDAWRPDPDL